MIVAASGVEGIAKTPSDQPDLVLMDMHLRVLDGWEATRKIKANPQTRSIPVLALTADAIAGEREKALATGCDEYDAKPVDLPRLLEKMGAADYLLRPLQSALLRTKVTACLERKWLWDSDRSDRNSNRQHYRLSWSRLSSPSRRQRLCKQNIFSSCNQMATRRNSRIPISKQPYLQIP